MKHTAVIGSSHVASIGHEGLVLEVRFLNGDLWEYLGVSCDVYNKVINAESVGKAFIEYVRSANYASRKIG